MKKTSSFAAIAVLLAVVAAIFVSSCSSEYTEEENCSLSENEKIAKLAEKYGLHCIVDDFAVTRSAEDDQNLEEEFELMSSLVGEYELTGSQNGDTLALLGSNPLLFSPLPNLPSSPETGSATLTDSFYEGRYYFILSVNLTWDITYFTNLGISATVQEFNYGYDFQAETTNFTYTRSGELPGWLYFSTTLTLKYHNKNFVYIMTGDYNLGSGIGTLFLENMN